MQVIGRAISFALFLVLQSTLVLAQQDIKGSADHPLVSRYPGSKISKYSVAEFDEFKLPLSRPTPGPAKTQTIEGKITRIVYDTPAPRSALEIYKNFESALTRAGFKPLFSCINNDGCGSSGPIEFASVGAEDWAWGAGHRFMAAKLERPGGTAYVTVHIGQWSDLSRGTQTVLFVVETKAMETGLVTVDAKALGDDIATQGHSAVYGIYFDTGKAEVKPESDSALKEIGKLMQAQASLKLLVVGHTDNVGALPANMDLSRRRADAVVKALTVQFGVTAARLSAQGAGPLAPVASNRSEDGRAKNRRVELVEQ